MNARRIWILVAAAGLVAATAPAGEKVLFEDRFDGKLGEGWTWLRENPQAWKIADNALEIKVEPGTAGDVKNALCRAAPDRTKGKVAIEVTVTFKNDPTNQFEQAGITWYRDGKPAFKLVHELIDKKLYIIPGKKPTDTKTVQLRLVLAGEQYTAQFRPDAKGDFQTVATGKLPLAKNEQVSIQCYNGPKDEEHWARFDDFRIVAME